MQSHKNTYEELWKEILSKADKRALQRIYKHFYPKLYQYALKLTGSQAMAEDAIHDTFLYLWQHRKQIGEIQSMQFYLIRSVRNACLKLIKKKNRLSNIDDTSSHLDLRISPTEFQLVNINEDIKTRIEQALNSLSTRQREIIYLKFYNNLDYEEIGEILNINYQSVVNHVYKGIQKLRKAETLQFFKRL